MLCGMFGKLPSKRDFVSYNMQRPFLDQWEEWLQGAVAASRHALGEQWQEVFLRVPIWRFWFGRRVYGTAVTGALMPSVDGVGRYFPLTICACEPPDARLVPPPSPELEDWQEQCETFLLRLLEDQLDGEPSSLLEGLPFAPVAPRGEAPGHSGRVLAWSSGDDGSLAAAFLSLKTLNDEQVHSGRSYWWTRGGAAHRAQLVVMDGRADAPFFTSLLTGTLE